MVQGTLLKRYSGFYYVYAEDRVWECSLRGRFRIKEQDFMTGDQVEILPGRGNQATIEKVKERKNSLVRPSIANVDQALLVFALTTPVPDLNLLDRLLIQIEGVGITPIIVLTKLDLWEPKEEDEFLWDFYSRHWPLYKVSSRTSEGIAALRGALSGKVSVLAGPSGVGKSSVLNALSSGLELKTGDISQKSRRGRHTTRHVELLMCAEGLVADTPGFSSLYLPQMRREELMHLFPEFDPYLGGCRFKTCLHDQEPDCQVKAGVEEGEIPQFRYEHYRQFLKEVIAGERKY